MNNKNRARTLTALACLLLTGVFGGVTYQASQNVPELGDSIIDSKGSYNSDGAEEAEDSSFYEVEEFARVVTTKTSEKTVIELKDTETVTSVTTEGKPLKTFSNAKAEALGIAAEVAAKVSVATSISREPETVSETAPAVLAEGAEDTDEEPAMVETERAYSPAPAETETKAVTTQAASEVKAAEKTTTAKAAETAAAKTTTTIATASAQAKSANAITLSEQDYILLCNCVAYEYGADYVSVYDKALVAEVVMNRVNSSVYPDNIYDVITQPYQFTGCQTYADLGTFSSKVSDSVKAAVDLYLSDPSRFDHGYIGFWGDGYANHFKTY